MGIVSPVWLSVFVRYRERNPCILLEDEGNSASKFLQRRLENDIHPATAIEPNSDEENSRAISPEKYNMDMVKTYLLTASHP